MQTNQNARISNNSQSEAAYTKHDNRLPCLPRKQERLNVVFQKESTDGRRTQNIAPYRRTMKILWVKKEYINWSTSSQAQFMVLLLIMFIDMVNFLFSHKMALIKLLNHQIKWLYNTLNTNLWTVGNTIWELLFKLWTHFIWRLLAIK